MDVSYFRMLFDYNRWANQRLLARAAELTDDAYAAPILTHVEDARLTPGERATIRGTLAHLVGAEALWLARCRGESPLTIFSQRELPTFALLHEAWLQQLEAQRAFAASLTDEALAEDVSYSRMVGPAYTQPRAYMLAHLFNHSTQHRSEVAVALTALGLSPGDLDLSVYLRSLTLEPGTPRATQGAGASLTGVA